jgi:type IV pilus assembly protein PilC
MAEVGLPPLSAIEILINQGFSDALTEALRLLYESINNGDPVSTGMRRSRLVFSALYVNLVEAGEISGTLPATLRKLALHLERSGRARRQMVTAAIYPCSIVLTAAAVSTFLLVFIIPSFKEIFADLGSDLPWLTRIVISISEGMVDALPILSLLTGSLVFIGCRFLTTSRTRDISDALLLKCPVLGSLLKHAALARVTRTLGTTLNSGLPILLAMRVSSEAAGNGVVRRELEVVREHLAEGNSLARSLEGSPLFPSIMVQMLRVGETTGGLDTILEKVASTFEEEVERRIELLKQLLEPTLILVIGTVVGVLVLAMYLPIFSMGSLLR